MLITFFRKLLILASFLFVLGVAQTQVSADGSSSSSSTLVNQDTLNAIDDASKQADKAVDEVTNEAEKKSGDTSTTDTSFKASDAQNINKLNDSLFSWQPYSEKIGVTDLANNTGMGLAKFFWYLNTLIYQINDELLSALSNDGNLSKAFTQAQNAVSGKVKSIFDQGKLLFGGLAIIVLAIMGFMHFTSGRTSSAVRMVVNFVGILLVATLWYGNGNELFNQINEASDAGQAQVLKVIGNSNDNVKPGDTLRVGYFERSIERPYFLMNYGKATAKDVVKQGYPPYEFISTNQKRSSDTLQSNITKRSAGVPTLKKDNSFNKAGMSVVAIVVSIVNAIPYDAVALFNIFVMVIELALYLLSPFVLVMALFPQFARNGYKIVGATIMWGIAKIWAGFLIVLVGALQTFTDSFIPATNFGSYAVNAFLFFFLVFIVYKYRGKLFEFVGVSYSRIEGQMPQAMRLSNLREKGQSIKQSSVGQKISQMGPMQRMSQTRAVRNEMKTKQAEEKRQQNLSRVRDQLLGKEQAKTQKLSDKNKRPLTVDEFKKPMDSKKSDDPKQAKIEKGGIHLPKSNFEAKQPNSRVNNPKSKDNGSDSQQEVAKKREAIKRQLYGDQATQSQPKTLHKVPDNHNNFEQSKTPKRQEIANDQKKTVNRDKIARELLAERDKQKEQKQKLRDEKGSQLKNKFGKDNS
ncbi:CD3337/EF1877 family mobilome membrane protein [Leuconostoc mesenteroides]|uniref:CD3337/EF1877 family mobilome membrane protein n=1 Tax=Leuconostoc mesenteroides TaxID=1245 RepID=UPI000A00A6F7|nr:peptide ABC transporter permease [Leuconostoc mesenteroides]ORI39034.1 peptide ABC transporter permease [Leuconostoc mesenteroides subsp. cremoris]ORI39727.1 peptide ABC transporter permease [Leuconostoc mesenteroides subsp. cremoris]ORI41934.1 peptide ABC transporter permease [Leuconostoc mesenteroides subsp. cremoris]ORI43366.1 peptide ABC transporter permease [Leuconostoc mesenteroides subsp. cremoris]